MKVTRLKNKSRLHEVAARIQALHEKSAEIGYFPDSGQHPRAEMDFASLAYLHAFPKDGYHHTRNWLEHTKPVKGLKDDSDILGHVLGKYLKLDSELKANDVLDHIGKAYTQKAKDVFDNMTMLIKGYYLVSSIDDGGDLRDAVGYKTTIDYTLRRL